MNKNVLITILTVITFHFQSVHAQTCSSQLEEQVLQMPEPLLAARSAEADELDVKCISASMDVFFQWTSDVRQERATLGQPEVGHYGYCESSDQNKVQRSHQPPCQSEAYMRVVQNSYNDVLRCLDLDPKSLFAITAVESGFHVNTYSLSGQDIGIGQLIPQAMVEVNAFWELALQERMASENSSCQRLRPLLKSLTAAPNEGKSQACSMMALPENPVRNLLYLGLLHQFHQKQMEQYFNQTRLADRLKQLTGSEWSLEESDKLKQVLVFLSYNAGFQGATSLFEAFLSEKQKDLLAWNQKYDELYLPAIDTYLQAMDLKSKGQSEEAQALLDQREKIYQQLDEHQELKAQIHLPKALFFAQQSAGSFGEYLVKTNSSNYLSILIERINHIENNLLQSPGLCAPEFFLQAESLSR